MPPNGSILNLTTLWWILKYQGISCNWDLNLVKKYGGYLFVRPAIYILAFLFWYEDTGIEDSIFNLTWKFSQDNFQDKICFTSMGSHQLLLFQNI